MSIDYFEKTLRSAGTFLKRWNGADGELLELTRSHKSLRVICRQDSRHGNLLVSCIDPQRIVGPVRWKNCSLEVETRPLSTSETGFVLMDRDAGLEVVCGSIEVKENVKID